MSDTFLSARWENLVMANYAVDPGVLQPFLPKGVILDLYKDVAYVSLVGFMFKNSRLFGLPIPLMGTFEEVNLRFYVKRIEGNVEKRGVVFINETVPYKPVAWLANKLYKEHYIAIPTKNHFHEDAHAKHIKYEWKINNKWNQLSVTTALQAQVMRAGSIEEFIFEHYFGYTKINDDVTQEYKVNHERWLVNEVHDYSIHCDFAAMYGDSFSGLGITAPHSVMLALGSQVTVDWKRKKL